MDYQTIMMDKEDVNIVESETFDGVSAKRKHFLDVSKKGNKWRARILHPKLEVKVHLGCYSTPEEAALVVKKKKAEFKETLKGEGGLRKKRGRHEFEGKKLPCGVRREYGKFRVRIWHPELKKYASFGAYSTCDEAAVVADRKRAELRELYGRKPRGSNECEDDDKVSQERRRHEFEGNKLPCGVRREYGKFRVRIWHPVLKRDVYFGSYSTCEEAAVVADRKRAELRELYGGKPRGSSECEGNDKVLQETGSETEEAAVVADRKTADSGEVYRGNMRGSSECEDDDEVLQECADEQTIDIKVPAGVRRVRSGKRVARIKDPVSSDRIWLGTYDNPEEAIRCYNKEKVVRDTKMKRAEFEEEFKGKEDVNIVEIETCDGVSAKRKHFFGVSKKGNKWQARIRHPKLKAKVHLGYYSTPEEAALVVKNKKAEFEETLKDVDCLREKRRRHEFEGSKLPCGVRREYGKFRVRIWHPLLKKDVYFGAYSTCEEAAVVADRKRAELRELYRGKPRGSNECEDDDKVSQERRRHEFEGNKLPCGVRREYGKFRVRIWHPVLKRDVCFGSYSTCEEATVVAGRKRAELRELYGGKPRGSSEREDDDKVSQETESESEEASVVADRKTADLGEVYRGKMRGSSECEDDDEILQEIESEVADKFKYAKEQTSVVKVPAGVRRVRSVKHVARVKDPGSRARIWLGAYDTAVQMGYDGLNNFEIGDRLNCGVVDVPDKLECQFVLGSPYSNIEPGTLNSACVTDKRVIDQMSQTKTTCSLDFDDAVGAGFINEYGQLVGKYRELDEPLWLSLTGGNFAASG